MANLLLKFCKIKSIEFKIVNVEESRIISLKFVIMIKNELILSKLTKDIISKSTKKSVY